MKNELPAISVVIPAYNEERYLPACLASLRKQTFKDFEIIVVDNNSTDKTAQIAESFGAKVVKEKKQGLIATRERGFKEAKAEIIARTDADSIVYPNWLQVIYETFQLYPQIAAITGPVKFFPGTMLSKIAPIYPYITSKILGKIFSGHIYIIGCNMALRKSVWNKVRIPPNNNFVNEDIDLSCRLSKVGELRFVSQMQVSSSLRAIIDDPFVGFKRYFGEYLLRYLNTLYLQKNPR